MKLDGDKFAFFQQDAVEFKSCTQISSNLSTVSSVGTSKIDRVKSALGT